VKNKDAERSTRLQSSNQRRKMLRQEYGDLFDAISALLFREDPIGINYDSNNDEYESEVATILLRLKDCQSETDVVSIVHQEFTRWFSLHTAGALEKYSTVGTKIWNLWQIHISKYNGAPND
jgi:hypothetical protein